MPSDEQPVITVNIEGTWDLSPTEVFPDGVPDEWDIGAVVAAIKSAANVGRLIDDWSMAPGVTVSVSKPNPAYGGEDVLFGDPPPRRIREHADVWRSR
jgi:hypothetical protein